MVTFLGRDGHRLTNLANLKYWGDAFCNYWGDGVQLLGGGYIPVVLNNGIQNYEIQNYGIQNYGIQNGVRTLGRKTLGRETLGS